MDPKLQEEKAEKEQEKKDKKEKKKKTETEGAFQGAVFNFFVGLMGTKEAKKPDKSALPDLPLTPTPSTQMPATFKEMMQSDEWQQKFEIWAVATQRGNSLNFIRDVQKYKASASPSKDMLVYIVSTYIVSGDLNIDDKTAAPLKIAMQLCQQYPPSPSTVQRVVTREVFDDAYYEVMGMLEPAYYTFRSDVQSGSV